MPTTESPTDPAIIRLGQIDIEGRRAAVTWPGLGDGVAIDFLDLRSRFGVVAGLDRDPRLHLEPCHASLVDLEGRMLILEQVAALWIRHALASTPAALRSKARR
ncbi:hypothetical protein [Glycomyces arizonensis]|uniref:hypothetical protein n=1 Tax=Glycomyces arizonensis TaxID=256035 RepID=UPI000426F88B|nr:hypothetical protein [Glycomyces arizonensis]